MDAVYDIGPILSQCAAERAACAHMSHGFSALVERLEAMEKREFYQLARVVYGAPCSGAAMPLILWAATLPQAEMAALRSTLDLMLMDEGLIH